MEVMGLMLGEFVDEYTVQVIDVFAMPQSGTTVSVESVDHVFQTKMMEMLKQTGRYVALPPYSHPATICRTSCPYRDCRTSIRSGLSFLATVLPSSFLPLISILKPTDHVDQKKS